PPRADAAKPPRDGAQTGPVAPRVPEAERAVPPLRAPRARAARPAPLPRARGPIEQRPARAPVVREPVRRADAADTPRARRDRRRRAARRAAALGPRRALVPGERDGATAGGRAGRRQ